MDGLQQASHLVAAGMPLLLGLKEGMYRAFRKSSIRPDTVLNMAARYPVIKGQDIRHYMQLGPLKLRTETTYFWKTLSISYIYIIANQTEFIKSVKLYVKNTGILL